LKGYDEAVRNKALEVEKNYDEENR
jgi:hypothetical protein